MQQQKQSNLRSKIRSAMMYPVLIMILTGVIGIGIAWFILPRLATAFTNLKLQLPLITKALIQVGFLFANYGFYVVPGTAIIFGVGSYYIFVHPKTKIIG